jgi:hypothetical protein
MSTSPDLPPPSPPRSSRYSTTPPDHGGAGEDLPPREAAPDAPAVERRLVHELGLRGHARVGRRGRGPRRERLQAPGAQRPDVGGAERDRALEDEHGASARGRVDDHREAGCRRRGRPRPARKP